MAITSFHLSKTRASSRAALRSGLCWRRFNKANVRTNRRTSAAGKTYLWEFFSPPTFFFALPKKSKSNQLLRNFWLKAKALKWSEAFPFDLCWNAKYVSMWTFVLTRWRSKQRWVEGVLQLQKDNLLHLFACAAPYIRREACFCFKKCVAWKNCLNGNNKQTLFSHVAQADRQTHKETETVKQQSGKKSDGWKRYSSSHRMRENEFLSMRLVCLIS